MLQDVSFYDKDFKFIHWIKLYGAIQLKSPTKYTRTTKPTTSQ